MSKRLQVRVDDADYRRFQAVARHSGLSLAEWVRDCLRKAVRHDARGAVADKLAAIRDAARHQFPTADIEQMLAEIAGGHAASGA